MLVAKTIVVALGGNAIKQASENGTAEQQFRNVGRTCESIVEILKRGYRVVLTHGNGPQAGNLLIQQEETNRMVPAQPLDIVGAMTQGQIGYMLQQVLTRYLKEAGLKTPVVTVLTQVLVDKNDPNFRNPSKPIGPFYTKQEAMKLEKEKKYLIKKVAPKGRKVYRRVVPSPDPKTIVEEEAIRRLHSDGVIVIASGGGGIPVILVDSGHLEGIEAVIDKDLAAEKLAEVVGADILLILTDIERVKLNYGKSDERDLDIITMSQASTYLEEGHFWEGSMKPKIVACLRFLESGGDKAIITSLDKATDALEGKTGTVIVRDR
jgi:carbamate kinase